MQAEGARAKIAIIIEKMPRVPAGGSHAVGAWMAEVLRDKYEVSIITPDRSLSLRMLNTLFGTTLRPETTRVDHATVPRILSLTPRLTLLKKHILMRHCSRISANYDVLIYSSGEADLGVRSIQYIHFPAFGAGNSARWQALMEIYGHLCRLVSGYSPARMRANLTLTNSHWTAKAIMRLYGLKAFVLYPPMLEDYPSIPWRLREDGFLCVGRIVREKRVDLVIRILKAVRARGWDVHLHIVGEPHERRYMTELSRVLKAESSWVSLEGSLSRRDLVVLLARHKFGLHGMQEEHFGMAVGEMAKAGCIVFVPSGGGQTEIVDDPRLIYADEFDAIHKICSVLESESLQMDLRNRLKESAGDFSTGLFSAGLQDFVRRFLQAGPTDVHAPVYQLGAGDTWYPRI